jgi:hypothetical protein
VARQESLHFGANALMDNQLGGNQHRQCHQQANVRLDVVQK